MAKKNEIKYNILSKTANNYGTFAFTKDNVNYVGNAFAVVYGMDDDEFKAAIEKSKAVQMDDVDKIKIVTEHIANIKKNGKKAIYTRVCFNSTNGLVHFFQTDPCMFITLYDNLYALVKDLTIDSMIGNNKTGGIVFGSGNKEILILPMKLKLNNGVENVLNKLLEG